MGFKTGVFGDIEPPKAALRAPWDKNKNSILGVRTNSWTVWSGQEWSGYDELDTRLRAKGVQDGPKKKAIRQAVQGLGGKGGPVRGKTYRGNSA